MTNPAFTPSAEMVEAVARGVCPEKFGGPCGPCVVKARRALSIAIPLIAEEAAKELEIVITNPPHDEIIDGYTAAIIVEHIRAKFGVGK